MATSSEILLGGTPKAVKLGSPIVSLSLREDVHLSYRNAKAAKDFIPGGTTQNSFQFSAVKRIHEDFELRGLVQYEGWKAPVYKTGSQSSTAVAFQVTWFPGEK